MILYEAHVEYTPAHFKATRSRHEVPHQDEA